MNLFYFYLLSVQVVVEFNRQPTLESAGGELMIDISAWTSHVKFPVING